MLSQSAAERMADRDDAPGAALPLGNGDHCADVVAGLIVIIVDRRQPVEPMKIGDAVIDRRCHRAAKDDDGLPACFGKLRAASKRGRRCSGYWTVVSRSLLT